MPKTKIIAFESELKGRELHEKLAKANNVEERIELYGQCTSTLLAEVITNNNMKEGFIISDCEGCEFEIFSELIVEKLVNFSLLIETHGYHGLNTTTIIKTRFEKTHDIFPIRVKKRKINDFNIGRDIAIEDYEKVDCMYEYSGAFNNKIKWLYIKSKK